MMCVCTVLYSMTWNLSMFYVISRKEVIMKEGRKLGLYGKKANKKEEEPPFVIYM